MWSARWSDCGECGVTYEVWISRDEMVDFLLYAASLDASVATRSKMSKKHVSILDMEIK
jgi:hypothetical protein